MDHREYRTRKYRYRRRLNILVWLCILWACAVGGVSVAEIFMNPSLYVLLVLVVSGTQLANLIAIESCIHWNEYE